MAFHTKQYFNGRPLVIGQIVLTATNGKITWAQLTYIELDKEGSEVLIFSVHFTSYPIQLQFVDGVDKLSDLKWCWTPKPS